MTTFARTPVELPVVIERGSRIPLTAQIAAELRGAVADGRLGTGERLPSSRALAVSLQVSRTVVTGAYAQLYAEGWLDGRHGSGTFVAAGAPGPAAHAATPHPATSAGSMELTGTVESVGLTGTIGAVGISGVSGARPIELRPGIPWASGIDRAAWRRAWRHAGAMSPSASPDPLGLTALRVALAAHLRLSRAMRCSPDQILVTRGVGGSLRLLAAALLRPGDRVAVEDPGYPAARAVFVAHGARVVACRADEHGLVVSELPADVRMVYTTPAHQYPLGGRLPVPRRQALIAWARATGALIVEDDYDSEFRYDVAPLPALFGMDPGAVVHLGTTTKTLTPALGVGWLVARPGLVAEIAAAGADLGERTSEAAQYAFLALLESGDLGRHVRRMRREYGRRRAAIVSALGGPAESAGVPRPASVGAAGAGAAGAGGPAGVGAAGVAAGMAGAGRLLGDTAGLHVVLELPARTANQVAAAALERGIAVLTLERYFVGQATRHGLVLGYGGASLSQVSHACGVLRELLAALPELSAEVVS